MHLDLKGAIVNNYKMFLIALANSEQIQKHAFYITGL